LVYCVASNAGKITTYSGSKWSSLRFLHRTCLTQFIKPLIC
ncbi:hypothetical protein glysoja_033440, partial [Glycine soja]